MRFWKREPLLMSATALSIVYGVVSLTTSHLGNPYIVIVSLIALVFASRSKVTPALRGHRPVAESGFSDAIRDIMAKDPHEHWPVSVHLAGYPERGVWKDSLVAYLCTDSGCSEQLSVEDVNAQQHRRENPPIVHGLRLPGDGFRGIRPGNPHQIGLVSDHLTPKDGGGRPLYGWSVLPGPNCAYCDCPFREGDKMHSVDGHSVHAECKTASDPVYTYDPPVICEEEEEWLWQ